MVNTPPFHGGIHGFEPHTHHQFNLGVLHSGNASASKTDDWGSIPCTPAKYLDIAQLGSASGLGPEGRRFESFYLDQHRGIAQWKSIGFLIRLPKVRILLPLPIRKSSSMAEQSAVNRQVVGSNPTFSATTIIYIFRL